MSKAPPLILDRPALPPAVFQPEVVPAVIAARGQHAGRRFVEFFTANIRNPNTRKAYYRPTSEFFDWCEQACLGLLDIEPVHIAAWVESLGRGFRRRPSSSGWPPSACCSTGWWSARCWPSIPPPQCADLNMSSVPARPRYWPRRGAPAPRQHRQRDRRRPARPGADRPARFYLRPHRRGPRHDVATDWHRLWVRLHEKGGKEHSMPCHHNLETYLRDYLEAAGLAGDPAGPLFRTTVGRTGGLTDRR